MFVLLYNVYYAHIFTSGLYPILLSRGVTQEGRVNSAPHYKIYTNYYLLNIPNIKGQLQADKLIYSLLKLIINFVLYLIIILFVN